MFVSILDRVVWVKVAGRANFTASVDFKALIHGLNREGFTRFVFDLSDCLTMDSTFLGVLAGFGAALSRPTLAPDGACVQLLNPSPRIADLIENLGIAQYFSTVRQGTPAAGEFQPVPAGGTAPSKEEISRTCLEAHQTLMELNPDNVAKFKDVAKFLAEDLKQMQKKTVADDAAVGSPSGVSS